MSSGTIGYHPTHVRLRPPRSSLRDGMLTARAAATLLTYLTEMNKAGASFFAEYMAAGAWDRAFVRSCAFHFALTRGFVS